MTIGARLFQAFGIAGLLFAVTGTVITLFGGPADAFAAFWVMGGICFVVGVLCWAFLWLYHLLDGGWMDE